MAYKLLLKFMAVFALFVAPIAALRIQKEPLQIKSFVNVGIGGFRTVSTLITGSESAVLIDMPLTLPAANALVDWIETVTDKPLVAVFATHHHVDHYFGGSVILERYPEAFFYASPKNVEWIALEVEGQAERQRSNLGSSNISAALAQPMAYNETFFVLSGHESDPIQLISNLVFDTVDGTMFWIPSMKTLIAGDSVYHRTIHPWMADTVTIALSDAWLKTLDFISNLGPASIVPGHAGGLDFDAATDVNHTRSYISLSRDEILTKGEGVFTPQEIVQIMEAKFPQEQGETGVISGMFLNNTAGRFGRGSTRLPDILDLTGFNDTKALQPWNLKPQVNPESSVPSSKLDLLPAATSYPGESGGAYYRVISAAARCPHLPCDSQIACLIHGLLNSVRPHQSL